MMRRFISVLGLSALLASCATGPGSGGITQAEAKRLPSGVIEITWTGGPADIYRVTEPDARQAAMQRLAENDKDHVFDTAAPAKDRPYFLVATAGTRRGLHVAERLLPLQGGRNFRDLGGYATADGKHVRWGKVYRSGAMAGLTDADYSYLSDLGITTICDFRTEPERAGEPTNWRAKPGADYMAWPSNMGPMMQFSRTLGSGKPTAEAMRKAMMALYDALPEAYAVPYAAMFARLAKGDIPLAFNCTAGKDRTGLAAALILTALGVPRETILKDYALSDVYVDYKAELAKQRAASGNKSVALTFYATLPPEALDALFASDPDYLEAAFTKIEKEHGSVQAYIHDVLQVSDKDLASIRGALLE
jgi:protein-tyrosine phosphatase